MMKPEGIYDETVHKRKGIYDETVHKRKDTREVYHWITRMLVLTPPTS
jgi:hypothetical protein